MNPGERGGAPGSERGPVPGLRARVVADLSQCPGGVRGERAGGRASQQRVVGLRSAVPGDGVFGGEQGPCRCLPFAEGGQGPGVSDVQQGVGRAVGVAGCAGQGGCGEVAGLAARA